MVYVDLNPVRAGTADDIEDSEFTPIKRHCNKQHKQKKQEFVGAINRTSLKKNPFSETSLYDYINLIRWTAAHQSYIHQSIQYDESQCLKNNHTNTEHWFSDHLPRTNTWQRAMGSGEALTKYAKTIQQSWIRRRSSLA
jgi:hypothetical protein